MCTLGRDVMQAPVSTLAAVVNNPNESLLLVVVERHGSVCRMTVVSSGQVDIRFLYAFVPANKPAWVVGIPSTISVVGEEVDGHRGDDSMAARARQNDPCFRPRASARG